MEQFWVNIEEKTVLRTYIPRDTFLNCCRRFIFTDILIRNTTRSPVMLFGNVSFLE